LTDLEKQVIGKLVTICNRLDKLLCDIEPGQMLGIMMDSTTRSFINSYALSNHLCNNSAHVQTVKTNNGNSFPIVVDNTMKLFDMKVCVVQTVEFSEE
jgi:hypothetical protein